MSKFSLLVFFSAFLIASCSDSSKKQEQSIYPIESRPAYDSKAINPSATVVELFVLAQGADMSKMEYDKKALEVPAGCTVNLNIKSTSPDASMPHNWVLVHKGTMEKVATEGLQAGRDRSFVPDSPDVLVFSKLLGPNEEETLTFPAPPPGTYEFVCTYPGHWSIMNGVFEVK
jgi:azurin